MPELPEVETVRNTLKRQIVSKKIKKVTILYKPIIASDLKEFERILPKKEIKDIGRIGKWLLFDLKDYYLLSHLRMEGKYFLKNEEEPTTKHEHVIITFEDGTDLRYHDTRKFGRMILTPKEKLGEVEQIKKLGMEPNQKELTKEYLYNKIHKKSLPIKTLLLDQTIISGLGNIYANEVLFESKINPLKKGKELSLEECGRICKASGKIIAAAIDAGGTTIRSYTSSLGVTGRFQNNLNVHKREGKACLICGSMIQKEKIGGRSTYFCPNCQKKKS